MAGFFNAVSACLVLLMLMSVCYVMGRLGWMTAREKGFVSKYIVNIAVPCNCIVGLLNNLDHDSLASAGWMLAAGVLNALLAMVILANPLMSWFALSTVWGVYLGASGVALAAEAFASSRGKNAA